VTRYTYGDTDLAAKRLALVAAVFESTSRAFLVAVGPAHPSLAVDLGCGPGYTTRLVHEVTGADRTLGLDASASHIERARASAPAAVSFAVHDAMRLPFPDGPTDLVFARLLVAHLADPAEAIARWSSTLREHGRILLDDLEAIETDEPTFRTYLDDVAIPVVTAQGARLLVGEALHAMPDPEGTQRVHDQVVPLTPPASVTARIFAMNLAVLTERGEVGPRPDLAEGLAAIGDGRREAAPVAWRLRQIAWQRTG
jgi:trans-aconitate 2-methyltransferase